MTPRTLVVVNPQSRSGSTGRRWSGVERLLRSRLGALEVEATRAPRDAERIAREAARAGVERILVAGGDGTVSEVVSGLLGADLGAYTTLGLLPLGTGGDLPRTLGVPRDLERAIDRIASGKTRRIDAGRLRYRDRTGAERTAWFLNVTSFGISGLVDELVTHAPRALGGSVAFLLATMRALARYRPGVVRIRADGELLHDGPLVLAAVANGRYFGGGMHVAPHARPDDGLFDVVVSTETSRARLLRLLPSLYRGRHLASPSVIVRQARVIEAEAEPGTVWLDVDGEPLGTLPARIEILPGAIDWLGDEA